MKILFVAEHLAAAGVMRQLSTLAPALEARGHTVSLAGVHEVDERWRALWKSDGSVRNLAGAPGRSARAEVLALARATRRLRRMIRTDGPDVVYAYHGNTARLMAWLATRGLPTTLVWGQQGAGRTFPLRRGLRRGVPFLLCRAVSGSVALLISNSVAGRRRRVASGFRCRRALTIPNGFDTETFRPDATARARVRAEWRIGTEPLIGLVARIDVPQKQQDLFLLAAARLERDVRFVVVGDGPAQQRLERLAKELGLDGRVHWAGFRGDMASVYNALDVLCSASAWEGFPNVVGEAMACGIPCVVTDAGDSARIVGETGIVVPPDDPVLLAGALAAMLHRPPAAVRARIAERFSVARWAEATEAALDGAAGSFRPKSSEEAAEPGAASVPRARNRP